MNLDIQYFAEEPSNEAGAQVKTEGTEQNKEKTYTKDEVSEIVQTRLNRALKEQEEKIQAAKDEATKLAKMNAEQKRSYELEQATKRANEAEAKLAAIEMQNTARKMLAESGLTLSDEQLALVVTDDAETTKAKVDDLLAFARNVREQTLDEMMTGKTPKDKGSAKSITVNKSFEEMSMQEIAQLKKDNPEQFKSLMGGI
ncbi:DUF4355 domain-containing protein [Ligilactobacillus agilis]|uniref:DUF4355 domain-containing protein n=1 Tax=Ligilactobacillus agilis TaxID=1601 RepID=UPI0034E27EC0